MLKVITKIAERMFSHIIDQIKITPQMIIGLQKEIQILIPENVVLKKEAIGTKLKNNSYYNNFIKKKGGGMIQSKSVEIINQINEQISYFLNLNREELYGDERLRKFSFTNSGKEYFERVFNLIENFSNCDLKRIPYNHLAQVLTSLTEYKKIFERAESLDLNNTNPKIERDAIVNNLISRYRDFYYAINPIINTQNTSEAYVKKYIKKIKEKEEKKRKKEIKNILTDARSESDTPAGASKEALHYAKTYKEHKRAALCWGGWNITMTFVTTLSVIIFGCYRINSEQDLTFGYLEVTALIVLSLFVYIISFCSKNFYAQKHCEIINKNKSMALDTFLDFIKSTESEHIKNQVLLHASTCAFSNVSTGYDKNSAGPLPASFEIVKQIANNTSK